jgi:hypothetical protein
MFILQGGLKLFDRTSTDLVSLVVIVLEDISRVCKKKGQQFIQK